MKKSLLNIALIIATTYAQASTYQPNHHLFHAATFTNHAQAWVNAYLFNPYGQRIATDIELHYVANLLYLSYRRAQETVRAQKIASDALQGLWHGWQNIAQRRLNPSDPAPYKKIDAAQQAQNAQDFWRQYALHQRINATYDVANTHITHGDLIGSTVVKQGIADMRKEARRVMLEVLTDFKQHLGKLFDYAFKPTFKNDTEIVRGIADFVTAYIPQLAANQFIHADALHTKVSGETWKTLTTIQDIGIQTWQVIETARMAFYKAHYAHVYYTMQRLQLPPYHFTIQFDENGLIPVANQKQFLPSPDTL